MKPIIVLTDVVRDKGEMQTRERTLALFGCVVYKRSECYPYIKDKPIGFSSGMGLTYVEDEE